MNGLLHTVDIPPPRPHPGYDGGLIHTEPETESVTHVLGPKCQPCVRSLRPRSITAGSSVLSTLLVAELLMPNTFRGLESSLRGANFLQWRSLPVVHSWHINDESSPATGRLRGEVQGE
jgi:hypothetical protein